MVNKIKRLNPLQIISFILLIISFTLFCFNIKASDKLFWISLSLNMLGYLLFIKMWSREGKTGIKKPIKIMIKI